MAGRQYVYNKDMQCPNSDGELISHTTYGENNLTVSYSTCPTCRGHWMESFAANFIKLAPSDLQRTGARLVHPEGARKCPVCQKALERATGENVPDTVWAYRCPENHGYFFPAGELAAFIKARVAKIEYHKVWNLPLPNVASVLLAGFLVLILTGGLLTGFRSVQNRQTTTSEAKDVLSSEHAYVIPQTREVLFTAQTQQDAVLTVHIPEFNNFEKILSSTDHRTHTLVARDIPTGSYRYYFTMEMNGKKIQSETFTFVMPR